MSVRRLKEPVEFVEYNPEWPAIFAAERDRIVSSIGSHILDIQHVGSTSIPNMAAKPVIDMMIEVEQITHIEAAVPKLEALEYEHCGELGIPGRIFFRKHVNGKRAFHIHAVVPQSEPWWEYVPFRDYLIAHPDVAREYEALKRDLAERFKNDRETYTNSKDSFIKDVLKKARAEFP